VTISNGVDTTAYRPPDPGEREALRTALGWDERPRALFVGRLVAKKGIDLAIGAARHADGAFELAIAGPGRPPAGLPDSVSVLGPQPPERVAGLYRAADALVLPSHGEGFPVVVQEAMASGLPVVVLDDPSYAPYLDGAGQGARRVPADPGAIAGALRELLADPAARASAREHARRAFSWAEAADAHEALYASL
jgi:D-inositol-3-phosphate glycosyltransferase